MNEDNSFTCPTHHNCSYSSSSITSQSIGIVLDYINSQRPSQSIQICTPRYIASTSWGRSEASSGSPRSIFVEGLGSVVPIGALVVDSGSVILKTQRSLMESVFSASTPSWMMLSRRQTPQQHYETRQHANTHCFSEPLNFILWDDRCSTAKHSSEKRDDESLR